MDQVSALDQRLRTDEVLLRYVRKMERGSIKPVTVLDFLGEQRVAALTMLNAKYDMVRFEAPTHLHGERFQRALGCLLMQTPPFLWTHEMRALAISYALPPHLIGPSAFPHLAMWWTFETALTDLDPRFQDGWVDAYFILRTSYVTTAFPDVIGYSFADGWTMFAVGSKDGRGDGLYIRQEMTIPDGTSSESLGDAAAIFGMSAFLNSHFVNVDARKPSDSMKSWRGRRVGDPASLNVVTLRSEVREAVQAERGEGPMWKQRWLVRGHLRAQWYPSLKSHKIIWIAPYLKGPDDAPLKVPVYRVAR